MEPLNRTTCKAARAMLNWKADDLAKASGVSIDSIRSFESGRTKMLSRESERRVRQAFGTAGLQVLEVGDVAKGPGVAFTIFTPKGFEEAIVADLKPKPVVTVYESSGQGDLPPNYRDGMKDHLGDDILSSVYNASLGETWPGVHLVPFPPEWEEAMAKLDALDAKAKAAQ